MSYLMDFETPDNVTADDAVMEYADGFQLVCDPKSLLYLFGMELDYSDALIGKCPVIRHYATIRCTQNAPVRCGPTCSCLKICSAMWTGW